MNVERITQTLFALLTLLLTLASLALIGLALEGML